MAFEHLQQMSVLLVNHPVMSSFQIVLRLEQSDIELQVFANIK